MKIVIPGGSGAVGSVLRRHFVSQGHAVVVLSRRPGPGEVLWDGETLGTWQAEVDGSDAVINLAGRTVNCRYTPANVAQMMESRILSTRVVGEAIRLAKHPPKVWLQASTATIYSHRFDAPNDELTGLIGGDEPGLPHGWRGSTTIAKAWEAELEAADTPLTRKVALRSAMTMSRDEGSVFDVLCKLARKGFGGRLGNGRQYVSWIHEMDFARAIEFLIVRSDLSGPINVCSPKPLMQAEFARQLREALGIKVGLPATVGMVKLGTWAMRTESELVLKSRRAIPTRLLNAGFEFTFSDWQEACRDLATRT